MRWLASALALAGATLAVSAGAAPPLPRYAVHKDGLLLVSALPDVLSRPEVRPHLTTGLTTSFVVAVTASRAGGVRARGAARLDIRWEPWDEVFFTTVVGVDGRARRETAASFDRLAAWWRAQELAVVRGVASGPWDVKVELSVVPFSQAEQRDAQRWFSTTVGPDDGPAQHANEGASRLDPVVDLLMATSIQRHSVVRYAWRAEPALGGAAPRPSPAPGGTGGYPRTHPGGALP